MDLSNPAQHAKLPISVIASGAFVALLAVAVLYFTPFTYLYCLAAQDSWLAAKTERELDGRIGVFHTKHTITPTQSMWGHTYSLGPGERMVQYLIFGKEPLDVVFDTESRVVVAFTSYE
jgi:membrane protein YdbS with pleckstrin-like domain